MRLTVKHTDCCCGFPAKELTVAVQQPVWDTGNEWDACFESNMFPKHFFLVVNVTLDWLCGEWATARLTLSLIAAFDRRETFPKSNVIQIKAFYDNYQIARVDLSTRITRANNI